jgi:mono/diheme cytochrome c family protein
MFFLCTSFIQNNELEESIKRGKSIYGDFCTTCHQASGLGVKSIFPPLANSDYLLKNRKESIHSIKYGQSGKIKVNNIDYNGTMAPLGLEDEEVTDVMNYILNSWGNKSKKLVTLKEVQSVQK